MENQVSSTNEIKYHFKGRTLDENFEVTYSLEERVWAAACAVVYRSCKASADMFQNAYDKPAPDFNTIFAWRQRLLTTGCLIDSHTTKEEAPPRRGGEKIGKRWWLRKKRFYMHRKESSDTSEDDHDRVDIKRRKKSQTVTNGSAADQFVVIDSPEGDMTDRNAPAAVKFGSAKDNADDPSSYRSSSSHTTRNQTGRNVQIADCPLTDGTRSVTPELTATRMNLARLRSPVRPVPPVITVVPPPVTFHDDIYFDDDVPERSSQKCHELEEPARFAIPEVPKLTTKAVRSLNDFDDSVTKGYLEDIVSESELHSSDGAQSENESFCRSNNLSERNHHSDNKSCASVSPAPASNDISNDEPPEIYRETGATDSVHETNDSNQYSPSGVDRNVKVVSDESENISSNFRNEEPPSGTAKNFSSAMRRIYERMSTEEKEKSGENDCVLEYVPTKIDPAMAKRNHQLFNSDNVLIESIHDIWPDNSSSKGSVGKDVTTNKTAIAIESTGKEDLIKSHNVTSFFTDYLPDEDALYRDASNDMFSDDLKTPPNAPMIGSGSHDSLQKDKQQPENVLPDRDDNNITSAVTDSINTLVNFNFASVNAEQLALALKNIQNMLVSKEILEKKISEAEKNPQIINIDSNVMRTESQPTDENKIRAPDAVNINDNIPFLDDMFDPGSPVTRNKEITDIVNASNITASEKSVDFTADVNLDDILECPTQVKKVSISGFQSFAIPKPIMLNRLKSLSRLKETSNTSAESDNSNKKSDVKIKKQKKRLKPNESDRNESGLVRDGDEEEEEEESGDDEDLSKYDLCGSEDDNDDQQKKSDADANIDSSSVGNKNASDKNDNQRRDKSRSPARNQGGDQPRKRSDSGSTSSRRSSSSSSSSSASSSGRPPKNRYDDFNLNSEHSRAGSREDSPNARSRSPIYPSAVDPRSRNNSDKRRTSRSRSRDKNKTKSRLSGQDGIARDKGRSRESNRDRDNRDRTKGTRDSRDSRRPHHSQNQNHTQNARYHHHPRGRGRGGSQMRRMW